MSTHNICFLCGNKKNTFRIPLLFWNFGIGSFDVSLQNCWTLYNFIIVIKHGFSCINIRQVPREVLKTEAGGRGFQHLPRDLGNVNALKNHA